MNDALSNEMCCFLYFHKLNEGIINERIINLKLCFKYLREYLSFSEFGQNVCLDPNSKGKTWHFTETEERLS